MKKRVIAAVILLPLLAVSAWFFWPELRLLTLRLPKDAKSVRKAFGVSVLDAAGAGGSAGNTFSSYRLGARRILWLQHAQEESINGTVVAADILYQFKKSERERISNQLLHGTAGSRADAAPSVP
jgi:hypothetical protein